MNIQRNFSSSTSEMMIWLYFSTLPPSRTKKCVLKTTRNHANLKSFFYVLSSKQNLPFQDLGLSSSFQVKT